MSFDRRLVLFNSILPSWNDRHCSPSGGPARAFPVPSQCPHPDHPLLAYAVFGLDGMSFGRSPLFLHTLDVFFLVF